MPERNPRNPTRVEIPGSRVTQYEDAAASPQSAKSFGGKPQKGVDNRKIVGVLVSYSWQAEGELFPVREGRTHIGRGQIKEEEHRQVEVCCPDDDLLSEDHALILRQRGVFYIQDLASVNGTFVNGVLIRPQTLTDLPNYAEIQAGNTVFTFLGIERKSPQVREPVREPVRETMREEEPPPPPLRDPTLR